MSAQATLTPAIVRGLNPRAEALRILSWWAGHAVDPAGGFYGEVDPRGRPMPEADKGVVLNARLLWFFSAIGHHVHRPDALDLARRAFEYLTAHFVDHVHGGVFWTVDHRGEMRNGRKQAYAQAFAVYGLAEFYAATTDAGALDLARSLLGRMEAAYWDGGTGGYIEARRRDWGDLADQRLSERDLACPKTMNTHLHIVEAYTRLNQVAPDDAARAALRRATEVLLERFVDAGGRHLRLFFDMDWSDRTQSVSFGHDIEASWLIHEAVETIGDPGLIRRARPVILGLAESCLAEGVLENGAIAYERGFDGHVDRDGEWWGQAEGLVGFVNAWRLTGDHRYLAAAERLWAYIQTDFAGEPAGAWTWYAAASRHPAMPLASLWKCPYHNGRAMLELDRRARPADRN
jgi:mannobiose 2-epimerase